MLRRCISRIEHVWKPDVHEVFSFFPLPRYPWADLDGTTSSPLNSHLLAWVRSGSRKQAEGAAGRARRTN